MKCSVSLPPMATGPGLADHPDDLLHMVAERTAAIVCLCAVRKPRRLFLRPKLLGRVRREQDRARARPAGEKRHAVLRLIARGWLVQERWPDVWLGLPSVGPASPWRGVAVLPAASWRGAVPTVAARPAVGAHQGRPSRRTACARRCPPPHRRRRGVQRTGGRGVDDPGVPAASVRHLGRDVSCIVLRRQPLRGLGLDMASPLHEVPLAPRPHAQVGRPVPQTAARWRASDGSVERGQPRAGCLQRGLRWAVEGGG